MIAAWMCRDIDVEIPQALLRWLCVIKGLATGLGVGLSLNSARPLSRGNESAGMRQRVAGLVCSLVQRSFRGGGGVCWHLSISMHRNSRIADVACVKGRLACSGQTGTWPQASRSCAWQDVLMPFIGNPLDAEKVRILMAAVCCKKFSFP